MNQNQQMNQAGQSGGPSQQQSGQADQRSSQARQDDRFGSYGGGQSDGQDRQGQGQQGGAQVREVATTASRQSGQVSRTGGRPATALLPPVDIYEDDSGFTVMADLPGVSKDQLVVRVTGDNLLIEGSASVPASGQMELIYGEVQSPQYRRSFTLSRELDPGKIEANLSNGVLRLRIPKAEEAKPRRIEVKVG